MELSDAKSNYLGILEIRRKAYFTNMIIAGGLFVLALIATTATLLLTEWNIRSIWLMGVFDVLFSAGFLMAWGRHEIVKENIDLLKHTD